MAHDLYARLMFESDDVENYPNIAKHSFFSILREYARGKLSTIQIYELYNFTYEDDYLDAFFNKIDSKNTETEKLAFVNLLDDIHLIHEREETSSIYPDKESLLSRVDIG
jgi:hypothetical protein